MSQMIKTEDLAVLPRFTFRAEETNGETVVEYSNLMKAGVEFPPVVLATWGKGNRALVDGIHRFTAAMNAKIGELAYVETKVKTKLEAELLAFKSNVTHGRLLTADEKRKACIQLLQQPAMTKLSHVKAAKALGVSDMTVKRYRDGIGTKSPKAAQSGHKTKSAIEAKVDKGGKVQPATSDPVAWKISGAVMGGGADKVASAIIAKVTEGCSPKQANTFTSRCEFLSKVAAELQAFVDGAKAK